MTNLADLIQRYGAGQITGHLTVEPRNGVQTDWPDWVPQILREALAASNITRPWTHQVLIGELLQMGQHAVLATGTGSGKSLAVWVPVFSELLNFSQQTTSLKNLHRKPSTLYLAPTKALSKDQENSLTKLSAKLAQNLGKNRNLPLLATVDGDTDSQLRTWARDYADIIFSNPDFVHYALLPNHQMWARFLRSLSVIVIDEFHHYRGNFGSQVSLILRRLMRLAWHYGARPKVVFLSATSPDPESTAQRFLGEGFGPVFGVSEDGSPHGRRDIFTMRCQEVSKIYQSDVVADSKWESDFADPDELLIHHREKHTVHHSEQQESSDRKKTRKDDADDPVRRSAVVEAGELTATLVEAGAQTLTFVRSRAAAERVAEVAQHSLSYAQPQFASTVGAYRGGYLPEERRALELGLREGTIRALATTSALELGIDISGLDAVVVAGWPGTNASFQQQIGRAGRSGNDGVSVFIGRDDPLDQYILENPQLLTQTPAEVNMFDPQNPWILPAHLCAAAAELPLTETDLKIFGLASDHLFQQLATQDFLKLRPRGWYWNTALKIRAHNLTDVRGSAHQVSIIDSTSGALLGTVSAEQADTTVYPGAIYVHQGKLFKVEELTSEVALVQPYHAEEIRTFATEHSSVLIERVDAQREFLGGTLCTGIVRVNHRVTGYDIRRVRDGIYLGHVALELPSREFSTGGTWFTLDQKLLKDGGIPLKELPGALHAAEHTMIGLLPLFAVCDRWDLGGLSTVLHPDTGAPTVIVHDSTPEGSGCALRGFNVFQQWIRATLDVLNTCPCKHGCPRCIQSPKCGNGNEPLDKSSAKRLLEILLTQMQHA